MIDEGLIVKDWRYVDLTFGLIYPNSYKLANSSYTIRLLYYMINSHERFLCERIFLPDKLIYPAINDHSPINVIRSLENRILPTEFDVLGFSAHYENDLKNILWTLDKVKIPLSREERIKKQEKQDIIFPLIIAGGPVITSNPLPLSEIVDVFFIGDSEETLIPFLDELIDLKLGYQHLNNVLTNIRSMEGIYIPSLNNHPKRALLKNLDESPNPIQQTISSDKEQGKIFEQNFFVEVNRGCPFQCKFCISSFHNDPFRNKSLANITHFIDEGINQSHFEKVSLIGSCISSHPQFKGICEYIIAKGKKLSIPSIRLDHLTDDLITLFEKANMNTITIAPETGSESLRFRLGKKITNKKILEVATKIYKSSIQFIKLYFLIGLPSETEKDIQEIINLLKKLDTIGFKRGALKVNINPFIPKLNTPYGFHVENYLDENFNILTSKLQTIINGLKQINSVKLKTQQPKEILKSAKLQTILSLGDTNVSRVLIEYYRKGARYSDFKKAEKIVGYSSNDYLYQIQQGFSPWII